MNSASRSQAYREQASVFARDTGFTLIELMTVIAIIGLLAAVLVPTAASVRTSANRAKTRVQFSHWAMAIAAFRQEYGCYPIFGPTNKVNGDAAAFAGGPHRFHDTLAGKRRDGTALPAANAGPRADPSSPESQNVRHIPFLQFTEEEVFPATFPDPAKRHLLHDAFENTDIVVLVDKNLDGVIDDSDYPDKPTVSPPDNPDVRLAPAVADFPAGTGGAGGVRAGVLFYSAPPRCTNASQLIMSWK